MYAIDDYQNLAKIQPNPSSRKLNLWAYVDAEDAGEACRLAVEADIRGHEKMIIAAGDTLMRETSGELAAHYFPSMPIIGELQANQSFLSSAYAEERNGYKPKHNWRTRLVEGD